MMYLDVLGHPLYSITCCRPVHCIAIRTCLSRRFRFILRIEENRTGFADGRYKLWPGTAPAARPDIPCSPIPFRLSIPFPQDPDERGLLFEKITNEPGEPGDQAAGT